MAFRSDTAAATLGSVLDELVRTWKMMSPELQGALDALIRAHGPKIGDFQAIDRYNVVTRVTDLLDALWQLQTQLPAQAVRLLQAGQATDAGPEASAQYPMLPVRICSSKWSGSPTSASSMIRGGWLPTWMIW